MSIFTETSQAVNRAGRRAGVGVGEIKSRPVMRMTTSAALTVTKGLAAALSMVMSASGILTPTKNIVAAPSMALSASGILTPTKNIVAAPSMVMSAGAALTVAKGLAAAPSMALSCSPEIKKAIAAAPSMGMSCSPEIKKAIGATPSMVMSASTDLTVGGGDFDPSDILNREFHYIANSLTGSYSDGDTLTSGTGWPDETGNYNMDNISASPTFETNEVNSLPVVHYDGSTNDRTRDLTTTTMANKFTIVYVIKTASTATQTFLFRSNSGDMYLIKRNDDGYVFHASNDVISMDTGDFTPDVAAENWQIIIWTVDFPNGEMEVYINSKTVNATDSTTGDNTAPPATYFHIPTSTGYPDLDLAELILYNGTVVSDSEKDDLLDFYSDRYDIPLV